MGDSPYFVALKLLEKLTACIEAGDLTANHIWAAWRTEKSLQHYANRVEPENAPVDLQDDLRRLSDGGMVGGALRRWKPSLGIPRPSLITWLIDRDHPERMAAFEALNIDRAAFARELLDDPFFGPRMRFDAAMFHHLFLGYLPEEERWKRLEAAVREFATSICWSWPRRAAKLWPRERAAALVKRLATDPEVASGLLLDARMAEGLTVLSNDELVDTLRVAILCAPYEACLNLPWIATAFGDRIVNEARSFMDPEDEYDDPWYGWWMDPTAVHKEFGPKGDYGLKLVNQALCSLVEDAGSVSVSRMSQLLTDRLIQTRGTVKDAKKIAEALLDLPECAFTRGYLGGFVECLKPSELGEAYRWILSADQRFRPIRFHVLREKWGPEAAFVEDLYTAHRVRTSWLERAMRTLMKEKGWRFRQIEFRRNERFREDSPCGYNPQVKITADGKVTIFALWRGRSDTWGDFYPERPSPHHAAPEVMIPPDFDPGRTVFENMGGSFTIHNVRDRLLLALPWSHEYQRRARY